MPYRITLDPVDPTIARVSRRIHRKIPLYLPLATRTGMSSGGAIRHCTDLIAKDQDARAIRAKAARSLLAWLVGLFSGQGK